MQKFHKIEKEAAVMITSAYNLYVVKKQAC